MKIYKPSRIPADPEQAYKGNGWKGWDEFLGKTKTAKAQNRVRVERKDAELSEQIVERQFKLFLELGVFKELESEEAQEAVKCVKDIARRGLGHFQRTGRVPAKRTVGKWKSEVIHEACVRLYLEGYRKDLFDEFVAKVDRQLDAAIEGGRGPDTDDGVESSGHR